MHIFTVTAIVYLTNAVSVEFANPYVMLIQNVELNKFVKIDFVKLVAVVILFVPIMKRVSTRNVKVSL